MESLIGLVNRIQRACTVLGDYGGDDGNTFSSLWEALPSVAVVGGQVRFFNFLFFQVLQCRMGISFFFVNGYFLYFVCFFG